MTTLFEKSAREVGRANFAKVRPVTIAVPSRLTSDSIVTRAWAQGVAGENVP